MDNDIQKIKNLIKGVFDNKKGNFFNCGKKFGLVVSDELGMFTDKLFSLDRIAQMLYQICDIAIVIEYMVSKDNVPYLSVRKGNKTAYVQCRECTDKTYEIKVGNDIYFAQNYKSVLAILSLTIL